MVVPLFITIPVASLTKISVLGKTSFVNLSFAFIDNAYTTVGFSFLIFGFAGNLTVNPMNIPFEKISQLHGLSRISIVVLASVFTLVSGV